MRTVETQPPDLLLCSLSKGPHFVFSRRGSTSLNRARGTHRGPWSIGTDRALCALEPGLSPSSEPLSTQLTRNRKVAEISPRESQLPASAGHFSAQSGQKCSWARWKRLSLVTQTLPEGAGAEWALGSPSLCSKIWFFRGPQTHRQRPRPCFGSAALLAGVGISCDGKKSQVARLKPDKDTKHTAADSAVLPTTYAERFGQMTGGMWR